MRFLIVSDKDEADIRNCPGLKHGDYAVWCRDGMVGDLPAMAIMDVLDLFEAYKAMKENGRIVEIPAVAYTLYWSMCENVRCESDQETLK